MGLRRSNRILYANAAFWILLAVVLGVSIGASKPDWARDDDESKEKKKWVPNFTFFLLVLILPLGGLFGVHYYLTMFD